MSKGKQWWPLQASIDEQRNAITEFQQRLRDRQWIKKNEKPLLLHVYAFDGAWSTEHLPSVNDYMQISANDPMVKNQARVVIVRLLSMLLKWHQSLRHDSPLLAPPSVFTLPDVSTGGFHYGIVANIQGDARRGNGKPLTLMVSDFDISHQQTFKGRHWVVPQTSDSFRWLTSKQWSEQKKKPSFGKWIYGSYSERRAWLEGKPVHGNLSDNGLIRWIAPSGEQGHLIAAIKEMGAMYIPQEKAWFLPEFWDGDALKEWLEQIPAEKSTRPYTAPYKKMAEVAASSSPPPATDEDDPT